MAESIRGINVVIGAETTGLSKALSDVTKKSRDIQSELKQVEKLLKLDPSNTELLAQKQKLLADAVTQTSQKLETLKTAQQQVNEQFAKGDITEGQYRAFQRELAKTEQELKGLDSKLNETTGALKKQGDTVSQLGKDYQESFDQAKQSVGNSFEQMKKVGAGITAVGAGIAAGLGVAVKAAADNETQLAKMETALQGNTEAAKEYLEWAKQFGKDTPFEAEDVVDATVKLKSYGIEAKNTMTSIGNMAAGMGKGLDQAIEAVADAQTGELERLKEFGITKEMLIDKALKLGKGEIVNAKGQITNMKALNDSLFAIMDERFKGGMERQSKTLNGQLSALKDSMKQTMAGIGEVLLPVVTKIVENIQKLAEGFSNLSPGMKKVIAIAGSVAAAIGLIGGPMILLIGFIPQIVAGFTMLAPVIAALTGPIGLIVAGIAALVAGGVLLYNHLKKDAIPEIERFGDEVSDSTQQAVGSFMDLNDKATVALNELSWSGKTVTQEMSNSIVGTFSKMGDQVLATIDQKQSEQISSLQGFFANAKGITEAEQAEIMNKVRASQEQQKNSVNEAQNQIKEILDKASQEKRALTTAEASEINRIQQEMVNTGIEVLSDSETEQKAIMERMKANAEDLSARQAAEVVANSTKQKDEVVKTAEDQYNNVVKQIIRQRDEMGTITAEQADKLIKEAQRQCDEVVKRAEDMHSKTVEQAKLQAGEHVEEVNWETGEILSKWEVFKNKVKEKWEQLKNWASNIFGEMWKSITAKTDEIKTNVVDTWNNIVDFFKSIDLMQIGADIMNGLKNGIKSKANELYEEAKNIASSVGESIRDFFGIHSPSRLMMGYGEYIGEGLAIGIADAGKQAVKSANNVSAAVASAMQYDFGGVSSAASKALNGVQGQGSGSVTNQYNMNGLFNGASIVIRSDDDIRKLGQEFGNVIRGTSRGLGGAAT